MSKSDMVRVSKTKQLNAADVEHIAAIAGGVGLFLLGYRRGGVGGMLFKIGGVAMALRGQQGYRRLYEAIGVRFGDTPTGLGTRSVKVESSVVVAATPKEMYLLWRNLENLPVFMEHLLMVRELDDKRSRWRARAPAAMIIEWDAEIINDIPDELIAWQTLEGSGVDNAGSVHFEPVDGGTRIHVVLRYDPPADTLGVWIAKIFRYDAQTQIDQDLRRFKAIVDVSALQSSTGDVDHDR